MVNQYGLGRKRNIEPIDEITKEVRKGINKSFGRKTTAEEKIASKQDITKVYSEDRVSAMGGLKVVLILWAIVEYC